MPQAKDYKQLREEKWRWITKPFDDYQVSNLGRVKSFKGRKNGKILKSQLWKNGYAGVHLTSNGKSKWVKVSRLVAAAFIQNKKKLPIVNHLNGVRDDDRAKNLEWCTQSQNMLHAVKMGTGGIVSKESIERMREAFGRSLIVINPNGLVKKYRSASEAAVILNVAQGSVFQKIKTTLKPRPFSRKSILYGYKMYWEDEIKTNLNVLNQMQREIE